MYKIGRFLLSWDRDQALMLPKDSAPLFVAEVDGSLFLWAKVEDVAPRVARAIVVVQDDQDLSGPFMGVYLGSVVYASVAWHVFDQGEVASGVSNGD